MRKEIELGMVWVVAIVLAMPFVGFCKADDTYEKNDNRSYLCGYLSDAENETLAGARCG